MPPASNPPAAFIGCDVGKARIHIHDSRTRRSIVINNDPGDIAVFSHQLDATCLVVCEATGGYEQALLTAMLKAAIPCHRADGSRVKAFLRSLGSMAKTDKIDAAGLAAYGRERHTTLSRWKPLDSTRERLGELVRARLDLVASRAEYRNRRTAPRAEQAKPYFEAVIKTLDAQIKAIDTAIKADLKQDKALDDAVKRLCAIKGIGVTTAVELVTLMPELGTLDRRKIASLGGLAPHPHQSGQLDRHRFVRGGRYHVKPLLFMAALSATRHHPALSAFYRRKIAEGKRKMVALVAVMRKLLVICNAVLKPDATTSQAPTPTAHRTTGEAQTTVSMPFAKAASTAADPTALPPRSDPQTPGARPMIEPWQNQSAQTHAQRNKNQTPCVI